MEIEKRYSKTIEALEKGERYQKPFSKEEIGEIETFFQANSQYFHHCLCLLQNTSTYLASLAPRIIRFLKSEDLSSDDLIHLLTVARIHVIDASRRKGKLLEKEFLNCLKKLLFHPSWEVKEWTVRVIDECGGQKKYFKKDLLEIFPSKLGMITSRHKRHVRGIIDLMRQRGEI